MAQVRGTQGRKLFRIEKWLGLNENQDGEAMLNMGEAAVMHNWRVTREGSLQIRPGYAPMCTITADAPVKGLWTGYVAGSLHTLALCGGHVWDLNPGTTGWTATDLGAVQGENAFFFGFSQRVYLLTGAGYYRWDGTGTVSSVEGYIPLVACATPPEGGGTLLEGVNKLNGKRRQRFSPDGTTATFQLAEQAVDAVLSVEGSTLSWTANTTAGTVTFASPPAKGVDTITITWQKGTGDRSKITAMRFAEFYNGQSDTRVFLYGDGTNAAVYSGLDENGSPTAEYFPDLNVMAVDSENTPITAMVRHYDRLITFKSDGAFSTEYDVLSLSDGTAAAAFYTTPLNREIGCAAPGQARLVNNNPRTLFGRAVYEWPLVYGANRDERNAQRISDRVERTLNTFRLDQAITFDDEERQEFYIIWSGQALVHHYGNNTWYYYNHVPIRSMTCRDGEIYFGSEDGRLMHFSRAYRNDDLEEIPAYWESGAMDFEKDWRRKYSGVLWVSLKPESQTNVSITVQSNLKSQYPVKRLVSGFATMVNVDFAHWSFGTNRKPQVHRVRIKVKKATFYKLIFSSQSASATATILAADLQIRYTGAVK